MNKFTLAKEPIFFMLMLLLCTNSLESAESVLAQYAIGCSGQPESDSITSHAFPGTTSRMYAKADKDGETGHSQASMYRQSNTPIQKELYRGSSADPYDPDTFTSEWITTPSGQVVIYSINGYTTYYGLGEAKITRLL